MLVPRNDKRYQVIRDALITARKQKGLRQVDLAVKLGVAQTLISKIETGERLVNAVELADLARELSIDLQALIKKL